MKNARCTNTNDAAPLGSTWFRVSGFRWGLGRVEERTVLRSTSTRVYQKDMRWEGKESEYARWFETNDAAMTWLRAQYGRRKPTITKKKPPST